MKTCLDRLPDRPVLGFQSRTIEVGLGFRRAAASPQAQQLPQHETIVGLAPEFGIEDVDRGRIRPHPHLAIERGPVDEISPDLDERGGRSLGRRHHL
jgi:hypothetical protein